MRDTLEDLLWGMGAIMVLVLMFLITAAVLLLAGSLLFDWAEACQ